MAGIGSVKGKSLGAMRHPIVIERRTTAYNTLGHPSNQYEEAYRTSGSVIDLSGLELERARQRVAEASVKITTRWIEDLTSKDRVRFGNRLLQIGAVIDESDGQRQFIGILCTENKE